MTGVKELPARKKIRLEGYDYSSAGYYFVTICVKDGHEMLGKIVVGDAPPRVPFCKLSEYGEFVEAQIQKTSSVYPGIFVDKYIVMPNHIHMIVVVSGGTRGGASPTKAVVPQIVQSIKSMTTKHFKFNLWQKSYHDHIIRNEEEYGRIWQYINENPANWAEDCYFTHAKIKTKGS